MSLKNNSVWGLRNIIIFLMLFGWLQFGSGLFAQTQKEILDREELYAQRLREAGLYEILESYLDRQLEKPRLADDIRTLYTLELGRTYADHATTLTGEAQQLYWQQAGEILLKEIRQHADNPQILRVKVEYSCLSAVKIQHYCRILELLPDPGHYSEQILQESIPAVKTLEVLNQELNKLTQSPGVNTVSTDLKLFQLQALEIRTTYELARLHLNLATLQSNNQVEFSAHLMHAEQLLKRLTTGWTDDSLTQQSWILLAKLYRLRKDDHGFQVMKKGLEAVAIPDLIKDQMVAEEVQLLLQENKLLDAEELANTQLKVKQGKRQPAGVLMVWHLQVLKQLADLAEKKGNKPLAEDFLKQIQLRTERLKAAGENYWVAWLSAHNQQRDIQINKIPELANLLSQAEKQYQSGEFKSASANYKKLSQQALAMQRSREAAEWGYIALSIDAKNQLWSDIISFAPGFYQQMKETEKAADIHFLWLLAEQQLLPRPWKKSPEMEAHVTRLQEHLKLYGEKPTASRVRLFMGMIGAELGMNGKGVRKFFLQVSQEDTEYLTAVRLAGESLLKEFDRHDHSQLSVLSQEWQQEFNNVYQGIMALPLSIEVIETQLIMLENQIVFTEHTQETIRQIGSQLKQQEQWMENLISNEPKANETLQAFQLKQQSAKILIHHVQALKCLLLFCLKDLEGVKKLIPLMDGIKTDSLLPVIRRMEIYSQRWGKERALRFQVAEIELKLLNLLDVKTPNFTEAQSVEMQELKIEAYTETGQYASARKLLEEELQKHPEQTSLAEKLITMYLESGTPQSLEEAAGLVKKQEAKLKAGTNEWLTYRIMLLETGYKQNKLDDTRKLLKMTRVLYPKAGTAEQREKLNQLELKLK